MLRLRRPQSFVARLRRLRVVASVSLLSALALVASACGGADPTTLAASSSTADPGAETDASPVERSSSADPERLDRSPAGWFPPLDDPDFIPSAEVDWLTDDDVVIGVVRGETALALPVRQMAFHHIANLDIDGEPFLVTY